MKKENQYFDMVEPNLKNIESLNISASADNCPVKSNDLTNQIGGGCPFMNPTRKFPEWQTEASKDTDTISYREYLKLDSILNSQKLMSEKYGTRVHDEHLFIIVHQSNFSIFSLNFFNENMFNESLRTLVQTNYF